MQVYICAYELKSVRAAGSKTGISQSAATKRIQQIEDAIGSTLFIRTANGLEPTEAGKITYDACKRFMSATLEWSHNINNIRYGAGEKINIVISYGYYTNQLKWVLSGLIKALPQITINLAFNASHEAETLLKNGGVDLAIGISSAQIKEDFETRAAQLVSPIILLPNDQSLIDSISTNYPCKIPKLSPELINKNSKIRWVIPPKGDQIRALIEPIFPLMAEQGSIEIGSAQEGMQFLSDPSFILLTTSESITESSRIQYHPHEIDMKNNKEEMVIARSKYKQKTAAEGYLNRMFDLLDSNFWEIPQ